MSQLIKLFIIAIIIILSLKKVFESYSTVNKEQWRDVVNYIDTNGKPGDLIIFYPGDNNILGIFDYYTKRKDFIKKIVSYYLNNDDSLSSLLSFSESYERVWFIRRIKEHREIINKTFNEHHVHLIHNNFKSPYMSHDNQELDVDLFKKIITSEN